MWNLQILINLLIIELLNFYYFMNLYSSFLPYSSTNWSNKKIEISKLKIDEF